MPRVGTAGRREPHLEADVKEWIEAVTGEKWPAGADYAAVLKDGVVLCNLINKLAPGSIKKINTTGTSFKMMENINNFQRAMLAYGCTDVDAFQTADLFEGKDIAAVTNSIFALGRQTYLHAEWKGPWLGPKPAEANVREFDDETIAAGKTVIGLQAGTNQGASQAGQNIGAGRKIILGK
ncbi:LOW QUALITY PROTEIN: muscle-specific protein 20-like [Pollicipes pollicipes]|uniref:LOW QUALITY PROTEIN: muscle-specific protein 20-like n=1 Tax=Pollicipes pollicipes TaxID=41117 RepID=UPI001884D6B3|nr:LOW QUALITY PROTEIN: muscle-specific protein 20-like [Pollicipes pollicipes]